MHVCTIRPQVFFSSSTMKDIIAPAAAQAASKKGPVRMGCMRQGAACVLLPLHWLLRSPNDCAGLHISEAAHSARLCAAGAWLHAPARRKRPGR